MDKKRYVVLNSIPRSGNTFLYNCLIEAIKINFYDSLFEFSQHYSLLSHQHNSLLLKIPKEDQSIIQFTNFRHPIEQIPSLFGVSHYREAFKNKNILHKKILDAINEYREWTSLYLENKNSNIILFEDIKNDINKVLKEIFNILRIDFNNEPNISLVKDNMSVWHDSYFPNDEERFFMGRLPRGFEKTSDYLEIQDLLINNKWINYNYLKLLDEYNQIVEIKKVQE